MSAILSADDLNDFISPGVACIKPVETLPKQEDSNPYEVTTEDKVQAENPAPASISLTDCLACSGCVTSAEAVLVSLQSHTEVLHTLDAYPPLDIRQILGQQQSSTNGYHTPSTDGRVFVASVSPQVKASIAATFGISERKAGHLIEQFLSGSQGLRIGGQHKKGFDYVVDTNRLREACLVLGADEVLASTANGTSRRPILTSACPGWICYAEKTHPHILPHLSTLKSPQALTGTLLKSVLSKALNIHPSQIWHLAIMPCFDKKLEASREELTDKAWSSAPESKPVRDVDCVITSRELLTLASARNIQLSTLPQYPLSSSESTPFPDTTLSKFLFPSQPPPSKTSPQSSSAGTSGGYLHHILLTAQSQTPNSQIKIQKGRNADVIEYTLQAPTSSTPIMKCARYYGFRNIQNLVRKLNPAKQSRLPGSAVRRNQANSGGTSEYTYVEVMACPGGCTNGGGQIKIEDVAELIAQTRHEEVESEMLGKPQSQKEWLARVDEAYFSAESDDESEDSVPCTSDSINGISPSLIHEILSHWSSLVDIPLSKLAYTTYRKVESDVGKRSVAKKMGDGERIAAIAGLQGGGW